MSSQLSRPKPQGQPHLRDGLTKRQTEVLERLELGTPVKKVARDMGVSPAAVYQHIERLRRQGALPEEYTPSGQPSTAGAPQVGAVTQLSQTLAPRESTLAELRSVDPNDASYPELIEAAIARADIPSLAYELGRADAANADDLPKRLAEAALRRLGVLPGGELEATDSQPTQ
jgi:DNA-binding CsgD family transcriptional regulator